MCLFSACCQPWPHGLHWLSDSILTPEGNLINFITASCLPLQEAIETSEWDVMAALVGLSTLSIFTRQNYCKYKWQRWWKMRTWRNVDVTDLAEQSLKTEHLFLEVPRLSYYVGANGLSLFLGITCKNHLSNNVILSKLSHYMHKRLTHLLTIQFTW